MSAIAGVFFDRRIALLTDIVENCERIASYVRGFDRVAFERDRRTYDAVERLRHAYDKVDAAMIWETVERDLPGLAQAARAARDQVQQ